jgi:lipopolysaccharide transport system ATP-binding protein
MSSVVIRAEGLGKRYLIGHQAEPERYTALRDVITRGARGLARSAADMIRGRQLVAGDAVEEFWALRDVSFEVKRGEVVGIIGRNGAGKSTLLKILSRITEPSSGRVTIKGRVASLLEVGTGFHPELTGRENIYLNGAILGMTRAEIRGKFDEIVAFAEVEKFLDTPVKRYSSGMYVRLAFAVAAHLEPEILVVDEVLAVGDAEFQRKCLGKMGEIARGGRTVLFVSHNTRSIVQLCDRGLLLASGNLDFDGSASSAVRHHLSHSVAAVGQGFIDLECTPPRTARGTREAAFASFTLHNSSGQKAAYFGFGEPFVIEILVRCTRPMDGVLIGFSFISADGREVQGTAAHDSGIEQSLVCGEYLFSCAIDPMVLVPGRYFIRAAMFRPGTLYHHIDEVMQFEVSTDPYIECNVPSSHFVGEIYIPYSWRLLSAPQAAELQDQGLNAFRIP